MAVIPDTISLCPGETTEVKLKPLPQHSDIILALTFIDHRIPIFHWLLFIAERDQNNLEDAILSGHKIHARLDRSIRDVQTWHFESTEFTLATSASIAAAAVIGQLKNDGSIRDLECLLERIPLSIPDEDVGREKEFTCRVWIRQALRAMNSAGFIYCPNVNKLEAEMKNYGRVAQRMLLQRKFSFAALVHADNSRTL